MAEAQAVTAAPERLLEVTDRLEAIDGFSDVVSGLRQGQGATLDGVWGSSCALAAAALARHAPGPLLVVSPHPGEVDDLIDELALFSTTAAESFPAWDNLPEEQVAADEVFGQRLRLLKRLAAGDAPPLVVTSIQALLQPVPPGALLARHTRTLRAGKEVALEDLLRWLAEHGFQHQHAVEMPGEFARRGGIVDIFAADWEHPVRVELFGDEVDSIRHFDVATQRSLVPLDEVELTMLDANLSVSAHLTDYLPEASWFLLLEPAQLEQEGRAFRQRLDEGKSCHTVSDVLKEVLRFPSVTAESIASGSLEAACHLQIESVERFSGDIGRVRDELQSAAGDHELFLVCEAEAEKPRLNELFGETQIASSRRLHYVVGRLRNGFHLVGAETVVLSTAELFRRVEAPRAVRRRHARAIDSFLELREGDLVVHVAHGIARYRGLKLLEKEDQAEEHLELEFHAGTKLYVPTSKIGLVQKYVGGRKAGPALARLGGRTWSRHKEAAQRAVTDLAVELLELQAARAARPGIGLPPDTEWQSEFDSAFPYNETPDQLDSIADIKRDMRATRPMDRLICGDVGYGKTELAMRAAFKAVDNGYQVAVLVPTTILAEQHGRTFRGRMAEYPFEIAVLSRFLSRGQQSSVLKRLSAGGVDIIIGTHRLIQKDVQFGNLGLVVIDEEQRFGVEAKERLKALRKTVDVLTLTATPIPRTLHMSLLGLRDISNLESPPEDRLAVETRVTRFGRELVRQAALRELNREGQIYFVHNRVHDIHAVAERLRKIVPEATLEIAHGQMPEHDLEKVMIDFVNHRFDMLVSTTIIESGLDIPNVNTIFIDQADQYGLADLHQLRGRVGRYKHRAYCYLLIDPNKALSPSAAKRLRAIEEFSHMGAGFAIAMRDLEIRGAGNILGTQQSGHIAAVGYELYCQLLDAAVRRLKELPQPESIEVDVDLPVEAYLPRAYAPDLRGKIDLYRRLAAIVSEKELDEFAGELSDRFGPAPPVARRLLALARLRILAQGWLVGSIRLEDDYVVLTYGSAELAQTLRKKSGDRLRVVDSTSAYLPIGKEVADGDAILDALESLLRPD